MVAEVEEAARAAIVMNCRPERETADTVSGRGLKEGCLRLDRRDRGGRDQHSRNNNSCEVNHVRLCPKQESLFQAVTAVTSLEYDLNNQQAPRCDFER
jgi:hypothetical protein